VTATPSPTSAPKHDSGEGGIRTRLEEPILVQSRVVSSQNGRDLEAGEASSRSVAQAPRSSVVEGAETARDERADSAIEPGGSPDAALVVAAAMVPKAEVVEAVENALHAFGVGRLDIAFEVLRKLLTTLKPAP
jgi:hypothetical protein